jgi:hypothetical protein
MPPAASGTFSKKAGLLCVAKTTCNHEPAKLGSIEYRQKCCPLTARYNHFRKEWARKYMRIDRIFVLFTDKSRAALDGWSKGWDEGCPEGMIRQHDVRGL